MAITSVRSRTKAFGMRTFDVLGVNVAEITSQRLCALIEKWVCEKTSAYVCFADVHSVMIAQNNRTALNALNSADVVSPDGTPLVWIGRTLRKFSVERVSGPDFMLHFIDSSTKMGIRHYFYGGGPGVAELLASRFQELYPDFQVAGWDTPPFRPLTLAEDRDAMRKIYEARADVVWVGLGAPKQEIWMEQHKGQLSGMTLLGVGAAFDMHAGIVSRAPVWMRQSGLEWLHRLLSEPRRLWKRYVVLAPIFICKVVFSEIISGKNRGHSRRGARP